ncbi:hypothetical protein D0Y65_005746 [Glycine soja]|uniref:Uncharacterized protein n=2 Tax=Glycine subgen. Soja TaxID=1462606 RepID=A0A0R0KDG2_SOYBN|nr:hypothetical protein D0Y65_005746 [Glycine soja]
MLFENHKPIVAEIKLLMDNYAERNKNHTPSNTTQDHQFVSHDLSYSTDDDLNMTQENIAIGGAYIDIGDPVWECLHCKAMMWYDERINKDKQTKKPRFSLCCSDGKIQLPLLQQPPHPSNYLLFNNHDTTAKNFQQHIQMYNLMFAFTSPGIKIDTSYNTGKGPQTFHIHGQTHHLIGSLLPMPNNPPKFAQLYIYDTNNEINNKLSQNPMHDILDEQIIIAIKNMLDHHNHYAQKFRMARDKLQSAALPDLKIKLISQRQTDGRLYNLPTTTEVATLIVGDEHSADKRDIIIEKQSVPLKRIHELHPTYLPLQYPFLYPKGEDGYIVDIPHKDHANIHIAKREKKWIVDEYCMIESKKLNYVRQHQQQLRVDKYINLSASNDRPETLGRDKGKRIILPSSFVGSQRYMEQLYFDGMTICGHLGFPDLFLTITCNPTWPEMQCQVTQSNLTPHNCPDIITRVFKIKLNKLMNDLKHDNIFEGIDHIISVEIPNKHTHAELFEIVSSHMMHGPCGFANKRSPCMVNGKCIRCFPKKFHGETIFDQDGFPVYRRRNDECTVMKNGIELDNKFVVPYNPKLLLKYKTHLNVEWCNQSTSIKYLFKYINKGSHHITTTLLNHHTSNGAHSRVQDEIKQYLDCRRSPAVERLYFHLENQQRVYWTDDQQIGKVLSKNTIKESMFTTWMHSNKICSYGRDLTYHQYISRFVYVARKRCWQPRKQGNTIGRLIWIPLSAGELFYLRMILSTAKGAQPYSDIRTVNGVVYDTFREACFAKGFLEANNWGTAHYLRKLFVKLLFMNVMDRPEYVWQQTWQWMRKYPKYVLLHFDGNKHFIRVRTHGSKCFFADGLKEFRTTHNLNESVILRFVSFDKNTTFSVDVVGPTHRQSRVKPIISTRRYIFTTDITQDMIHNSLPLIHPATSSRFVYGSKKTITLQRGLPKCTQWHITIQNDVPAIAEPWFNFIHENKLIPGDEVVFYYRFDEHAWEVLIRKDIEWDNEEINFDD